MSPVTREPAPADVGGIVRFVNLIAAVGRSPRATRRLQTVVQATITITDTRALVRLMPDRRMTVKQAAAVLEVDLSRASRQLARLEDLDLVLRTTDPEDRRSSWITITETGRRLLRAWWAVWVNDYLVAVEDWSTSDLARLGELIRRLHHAMTRDEVSPAIDLPAGWVERAVPPGTDMERRALLERFGPAVVTFVEWTGLTSNPAVNNLRLAQLAKSPVAMRSLIALRIVARHGPMAVSELAERLGIDPSRASKYATELADKALLIRAVDTLDRRSSRLRATRKGAELVRRMDRLQHERVREAVTGWPPGDVADCASLLERYADDLASGHVDAQGWAVPPAGTRAARSRAT